VLRSGDSDVQPTVVEEEAQGLIDVLFIVASNSREYDNILFTALESIYCVNLDGVLDVAALVRAQLLQAGVNLANLGFVGRDHTNLVLDVFESTLEGHLASHVVNEHLHEVGFLQVTLRLVVKDLVGVPDVEEHHPAGDGSRQVADGRWLEAAANRLMVSDRALVELVGGECSDCRMHSKLDSKHRLSEPTVQQSLEHTPTVASLIGVTGERSRRQLLLVTHQNDTSGSQAEGDQG